MRDQFDLDPSILYLNSGTHSLCPRSVLEAVTRYQREYERNPTAGLFEIWSRLWRVQSELADVLKADAADLFLRPNVTAALNDFILGAPLPPRSEIVVTDLEYGAVVNLCRFRAERDGLRLRTCDAEAIAGDVARELRPETAMLVVSHVSSCNGRILPIEKIARETSARGILLVVDGAHAPGALELDFSRFGQVDFYGGNLHKWMMGPKGTGFGWVNKRLQEKLPPPGAGWPTYETTDFMKDFGAGSRFAQRFAMLGCHDFAPFLAISDTLKFWRAHGHERIRGRIYELLSATEREMDGRALPKGWKKASPPAGPERGPLVAYEFPERLQPQGWQLIHEILGKHRLQINVTNVRGKAAARLSPHVYNTEEEVRRGVAILSAL